jgi:serine/threonine protein kinase
MLVVWPSLNLENCSRWSTKAILPTHLVSSQLSISKTWSPILELMLFGVRLTLEKLILGMLHSLGVTLILGMPRVLGHYLILKGIIQFYCIFFVFLWAQSERFMFENVFVLCGGNFLLDNNNISSKHIRDFFLPILYTTCDNHSICWSHHGTSPKDLMYNPILCGSNIKQKIKIFT